MAAPCNLVLALVVTAMLTMLVQSRPLASQAFKGSLSSLESDHPIIVVGGGLAGLVAAVHAHELGAHVVLLEKEKSVGGNSAKATSGINACNSEAQKSQDINDSEELFEHDTTSSGDGLSVPELVHRFVAESGPGLAWLTSFNLSLSHVTQLGGHSVARTHRPPPRADGKPVGVGFSIVNALKTFALANESISVVTQTRVEHLIVEAGTVVGVMYRGTGNEEVVEGELRGSSVILASANRELVSRLQPALATLATTNGPWATGDALALGEEVNADIYELDKVHPTGLVHPDTPNEMTKFLGPEALRGVGGILLNNKGKRFANELMRRDHLTAAIRQENVKFGNLEAVAWIVLNQAALDDFGPANLAFYQMKGLVQTVDDAQGLATLIGCSEEDVMRTFGDYKAAAETGKDDFGKSVFKVTFEPNEKLYVAMVTPVIHYTMGGLRINRNAEVIDKDGHVVDGLFAAGEASGGLHGANRLGGNSLAECVVFGKIAAQQAAMKRAIRLKTREEL